MSIQKYLIITTDEHEKTFFKTGNNRILFVKISKVLYRYVNNANNKNVWICLLNEEEASFIQKNKEIIDFVNKLIKEYSLDYNQSDSLIVSIHFGKMRIPDYLKKQIELKGELDSLGNKDMSIIYHSSWDNSSANRYIDRFFKQYSWKQLFEENNLDLFLPFLELLKSRADGKAIEFSDLEKKKQKIINSFLPVAIDCLGINKLEEKNESVDNYKIEAFGKRVFRQVLLEKDSCSQEIASILEEETEKIFKNSFYNLVNSNISDFPMKYKDFYLVVNNLVL